VRTSPSPVKSNINPSDTSREGFGPAQSVWELLQLNQAVAAKFTKWCEELAIAFKVDPATLWTVDLLERRKIHPHSDPEVLLCQVHLTVKRLAYDARRKVSRRGARWFSLNVDEPAAILALEFAAVRTAQADAQQAQSTRLERMAAVVQKTPGKFPVHAAKVSLAAANAKLAGAEPQCPIQNEVAAQLGMSQSSICRASKIEHQALRSCIEPEF